MLTRNKFDIWPVTIVKDRYSGAYSDGIYLAHFTEPDDVPLEPNSDDVDAMNFWYEFDNFNKNDYSIGKGETPDIALENLFEILNKRRII